jgi:hypothetical protein
MYNQDYIDLLSGYLINHFRPYTTYQEGVDSAIRELSGDSSYLKEMKKVFNYFLHEQTLEKNFVRKLIRRDGNYSVSTDVAALKRLQFIYEDTISQKEEHFFQEEEEEEEEVYDPLTMDIEILKKEILNSNLGSEKRIYAALMLRQSNDHSFIPILLEAIQEQDNQLRYGFVLVLIWGSYWKEKLEVLSSLLLHDPYNNIRSSIAGYLELQAKAMFSEEKVVNILLKALKQETCIITNSALISALSTYEVNGLDALLANIDLGTEKHTYMLDDFLSKTPKTNDIAKTLLNLLDTHNEAVQTIVVKQLKYYPSTKVVHTLENLIQQQVISPKLQHHVLMSLDTVRRKIKKQQSNS